jgi:mRNA interferase MazF
MGMVIKRFDVYLVNLDPTIGTEIQRTRPCLVISPNEMNRHLRTVVIAPMTTQRRSYPTRVACRFQGRTGEVVIDQIRTVDRTRLFKRLGRLNPATSKDVLRVLQEMFKP